MRNNNEMPEILVEGRKIKGFKEIEQVLDLPKWVRNLGVYKEEYWKVNYFVVRGFMIDERMQIDYGSGAHSGKCMKFLIAKLIMHRAKKGCWGLNDESEVELLTQWTWGRDKTSGKSDGSIFHIVTHQDKTLAALLATGSKYITKKG